MDRLPCKSGFFFFTYEMVQDLRISSIFFDSISNLEAMATLSVLNIIKITTLPNHLKFFRTEVPPQHLSMFFFQSCCLSTFENKATTTPLAPETKRRISTRPWRRVWIRQKPCADVSHLRNLIKRPRSDILCGCRHRGTFRRNFQEQNTGRTFGPNVNETLRRRHHHADSQ